MRVKICGMNDAAAFETAVDAGADYVGFVFFPRSPRFVTPAQAAAIRAVRPNGPPAVGLFVKPGLEQIAETLETMPLDIFQIYGEPDLARAIRARFGRPVWLARGVSSRNELPAAEAVGAGLDALMIESKPPPGADRPGGNATALDWSILAGWKPSLPWLLAGGLTPENVAEAIAASGAEAVDVSSGVESSPGVKDLTRIRNFIMASRNAGRGLSAGTDAEYESTGQGVS